MYMVATNIPLSPQGGENQETELLTVKEACEALRISAWTFYRLVRQRQISTIRIGRRRFVPVMAIRKFIQQRSEELA